MFKCTQKDFSLAAVIDSGQVFRLRHLAEGCYLALSDSHGVVIRQEGEHLLFYCPEEEFHSFWYDYFDLKRDYGKIAASIDPDDAFLTAALAYGQGLRVLKQDLWEMIVSFLISQNNNISRIRNSIEAMCVRFGEEITVEWPEAGSLPPGFSFPRLYAFPTPEALCSGGIEGLSGLGLGYRDKYILRMAQRCCGEEGRAWLRQLKQCDYPGAVSLLLQEFGIGRKVADCICLFALHHVDAFPVDTHIRQILDACYPDGFPFERYEGYAGILQQYMFYYKLSLPRKQALDTAETNTKEPDAAE